MVTRAKVLISPTPHDDYELKINEDVFGYAKSIELLLNRFLSSLDVRDGDKVHIFIDLFSEEK